MAPSRSLDDLPGSLPAFLVPGDVNLAAVQDVAQQALEAIHPGCVTNDILWRDWLALTGAVRTFYSADEVVKVWNERASSCHLTSITTTAARITKPVPASSWVDVPFTFTSHQEHGLTGSCSGIASLVQDKDRQWRIWMLVTVLENFDKLGHPDLPLGERVDEVINDDCKSVSRDFDVIVIGAGQCGLALAGRLGALRIKYVLLEKQSSIGNNWIRRYESVRQHTIREINNLPFGRTWKSTDPLLLPGKVVAEGFENYVMKYDINLWTSSEATKASWDVKSRVWTIEVVLDGEERRKLNCRHLVIAIGAGASVDNDPKFPGIHKFQGVLQYSGAYKHSRDWKGKAGVVIGTGTTAHDVAQDMLGAGLSSVTMIQRNKTAIYPIEWVVKGQEGFYNDRIPTAEADIIIAGRPNKVLRDILKLNYEARAELEHERFDALERVGFRVDRHTSMMDNILQRFGGFYIDVGTCAHVANGSIKVKSGIPITTFYPEGIQFADGSDLKADVVVVATGHEMDYRKQISTIIGNDLASILGEFWGLDDEGEVRNIMKPAAPGLWLFGGTSAQSRWWSRFLVLQIQSDLLGKPPASLESV